MYIFVFRDAHYDAFGSMHNCDLKTEITFILLAQNYVFRNTRNCESRAYLLV